MQLPEINAPAGAFLAGLITSVHCIGMCGPLACAICPTGAGKRGHATLGVYHMSRLVSYVVLGALAGALGQSVGGVFQGAPTKLLPWAFVILFVGIALGLDKYLPSIPVLNRVFAKFQTVLNTLRGIKAGALLGLFTPFLPCGPLYLVIGVALFSGSAVAGGQMMAMFALGTIALLWVLQAQLLNLSKIVGPVTLQRIQRALAIFAALLIIWRVTGGATFDPSDPAASGCRH